MPLCMRALEKPAKGDIRKALLLKNANREKEKEERVLRDLKAGRDQDKGKAEMDPAPRLIGGRKGSNAISPKRRLNPKDVYNSMEKVGKISSGDSPDEVIADSVIDFFNGINLLYGKLTEYCTNKTCPVMSAGPKYEFLWADGKAIVKPIKVSAPEYADYLLTWVQNTIEDETVFPIEKDKPYPPDFIPIMKNVFKRLFRIYAHIYCSHAEQMKSMGLQDQLDSAFKHFYRFIRAFNLVDPKEMICLQPITDKIIQELKRQDQENQENK